MSSASHYDMQNDLCNPYHVEIPTSGRVGNIFNGAKNMLMPGNKDKPVSVSETTNPSQPATTETTTRTPSRVIPEYISQSPEYQEFLRETTSIEQQIQELEQRKTTSRHDIVVTQNTEKEESDKRYTDKINASNANFDKQLENLRTQLLNWETYLESLKTVVTTRKAMEEHDKAYKLAKEQHQASQTAHATAGKEAQDSKPITIVQHQEPSRFQTTVNQVLQKQKDDNVQMSNEIQQNAQHVTPELISQHASRVSALVQHSQQNSHNVSGQQDYHHQPYQSQNPHTSQLQSQANGSFAANSHLRSQGPPQTYDIFTRNSHGMSQGQPQANGSFAANPHLMSQRPQQAYHTFARNSHGMSQGQPQGGYNQPQVGYNNG